MVGWFFSDYRVSPNFLVVLGLRLWLRLGLGCDNSKYNFPIVTSGKRIPKTFQPNIGQKLQSRYLLETS